jgi:hypothetical protein
MLKHEFLMSFYDLIFLRYKINKTQVICITSGAGTTSAPEHLDLPQFLVVMEEAEYPERTTLFVVYKAGHEPTPYW